MVPPENDGDGGSFTFVDKRHRGKPEPQPAGKDAPEREPAAAGDEGGLKAPPIDFSTFVLSLASNAVYCMGGFQDPVSGKTSINLDQAKQSIDILTLLEEKTRGNLDSSEAKLLSHLLYDLRMKFVEASRK